MAKMKRLAAPAGVGVGRGVGVGIGVGVGVAVGVEPGAGVGVGVGVGVTLTFRPPLPHPARNTQAIPLRTKQRTCSNNLLLMAQNPHSKDVLAS